LTVAGFLPLLGLLFICLTIHRRRSAAGDPNSGLYAFLSGSTLWTALLVAATETLSLVAALTSSCLAVFWTAAAVLSAVLYIATLRKFPPQPRQPRPRYSLGQMLLLAAILAIAATIGSVAFIGPPNTWDSMDYHMPRVLYWIQNRTVDFYPTHCARQNWAGPGAAYVVMHFQMMSGSDHFANFVQWGAMIGCLIASTFLCARFGLGRTAALCSALFIAAIPMGTLEASSTYVDYVVAFWVMSFACFTARPEAVGREEALSRLLPGLSLGLAILAKATAYLFAAPFLIWFVAVEIRRRRFAAVAPLAACAALTLLLNAGHYSRCWDLYGNPLGVEVSVLDRGKNITDKLSNDSFTPRALLSNFIRHTATHFHMTPSVTVNLAVEDAVVRLHKLIGADVNDRRTTWENRVFPPPVNRNVLKNADARRSYRSDEGVSNPLHFLLIFLALAMILGRKALRRKEEFLVYSLCCAAGFLLFCGYVKWNDWHSRLHLPFFVFSAPFVAATLFNSVSSRLGNLWRAVSMTALTCMAIPTLLYSCERPVLGDHNMLAKTRHDRYFWFPRPKEPFVNAQQFLRDRKVNAIGFVGADWEYPMMVLLRQDHPEVSFLSVNVTDRSKVKSGLERFRDFRPDAIVSLRWSDKKRIEPEIIHNGRVFQLRSKEGHIGVFLPANEKEQQ
jgi:hypothetical protein